METQLLGGIPKNSTPPPAQLPSPQRVLYVTRHLCVFFVKNLIGDEQDEWLEAEDNLERWTKSPLVGGLSV